MDIRDEIARLSAEHDKLMREDAQWMAKREAAREALRDHVRTFGCRLYFPARASTSPSASAVL